MLTLYCRPDSKDCQDVDDTLKDLVIHHRRVDVAGPESLPPLLRTCSLPAMTDGPEVYCGLPQMMRHLTEIDEFAQKWRKYQSDACYCDDQGNVE